MEETKETECCIMTNEEYKVSSPDYGELIIEMVHKISDRWILEQIYRYIINMTKEG